MRELHVGASFAANLVEGSDARSHQYFRAFLYEELDRWRAPQGRAEVLPVNSCDSSPERTDGRVGRRYLGLRFQFPCPDGKIQLVDPFVGRPVVALVSQAFRREALFSSAAQRVFPQGARG
jgi:hypothetical protein